jgi:hypothetical protein
LLFVGAGQRHGKTLEEEKIARISGADFHLVALAAEAIDGFEEKYFTVGHGSS